MPSVTAEPKQSRLHDSKPRSNSHVASQVLTAHTCELDGAPTSSKDAMTMPEKGIWGEIIAELDGFENYLVRYTRVMKARHNTRSQIRPLNGIDLQNMLLT